MGNLGITFRADSGAAVNVKVYRNFIPNSLPRALGILVDIVSEYRLPSVAAFCNWYNSKVGIDGETWAEIAITWGWDFLNIRAGDIFRGLAGSVEVNSEGRSGGWAVLYLDGQPLRPDDFSIVRDGAIAAERNFAIRKAWSEFVDECEQITGASVSGCAWLEEEVIRVAAGQFAWELEADEIEAAEDDAARTARLKANADAQLYTFADMLPESWE